MPIGLEWCTAQLGHFWIELRIKSPHRGSNQKKNAFIKTNKEKSNESEEIERQESEENRLVDYKNEEVELIDKISEKRSEISGLSSHR